MPDDKRKPFSINSSRFKKEKKHINIKPYVATDEDIKIIKKRAKKSGVTFDEAKYYFEAAKNILAVEIKLKKLQLDLIDYHYIMIPSLKIDDFSISADLKLKVINPAKVDEVKKKIEKDIVSLEAKLKNINPENADSKPNN